MRFILSCVAECRTSQIEARFHQHATGSSKNPSTPNQHVAPTTRMNEVTTIVWAADTYRPMEVFWQTY